MTNIKFSTNELNKAFEEANEEAIFNSINTSIAFSQFKKEVDWVCNFLNTISTPNVSKKVIIPLNSLIKYNYENMPEDWKTHNPHPYPDVTFIYLGEIPNMPGHCYCQDIKTGKGHIFHPADCIVLTEEDV